MRRHKLLLAFGATGCLLVLANIGRADSSNCRKSLEGHSYHCDVNRQFSDPILACLKFSSTGPGPDLQLSATIGMNNGPSVPLGSFECGCGATGRFAKLSFQSSRSFYCLGPGLVGPGINGTYAFTGRATRSGQRISRGEIFVSTTGEHGVDDWVFECTQQASSCP